MLCDPNSHYATLDGNGNLRMQVVADSARCPSTGYCGSFIGSNSTFNYIGTGSVTIAFRAKIPGCAGCWPGLWWNNEPGAQVGEIDALEVYGDDFPTSYAGSYFNWNNGVQNGAQNFWCSAPGAPVLSNAFHTYTATWNSSTLSWSVDGVPCASVATPEYSKLRPGIIMLDLANGMNAVGGTGEMLVAWAAVQ